MYKVRPFCRSANDAVEVTSELVGVYNELPVELLLLHPENNKNNVREKINK